MDAFTYVPLPQAIYYDPLYDLLYIFTRRILLNVPYTRCELDSLTTRKIQRGEETLFYDAIAGYFLLNDTTVRVKYEICPEEEFTRWFEENAQLSVFVRSNGIPVHLRRLMDLPRQFIPIPSLSYPVALPQVQPRLLRTKPHLVSLVLKNAIEEKKLCPITLDPITLESICIAPCYHCFTKEAIETWILTNGTCPECREICV